MSIPEVIENNRLVAGAGERFGGVTPDVPRSPGRKYVHPHNLAQTNEPLTGIRLWGWRLRGELDPVQTGQIQGNQLNPGCLNFAHYLGRIPDRQAANPRLVWW